MAGKIIADTLETGAGADIATSYVVNGSAKAWTMDETLSTSADVTEDSFNIASTIDSGTGDLDVTFTNAFSANNYCSTGSAATASANDIITTRYADSTSSKDDILNYDGAYKDSPICYVAFGDLA